MHPCLFSESWRKYQVGASCSGHLPVFRGVLEQELGSPFVMRLDAAPSMRVPARLTYMNSPNRTHIPHRAA